MIWETYPGLRNINKRMTLVSVESIKVGDLLVGDFDSSKASLYTVDEVLSVRPASLTKKTISNFGFRGKVLLYLSFGEWIWVV